MHGAGEQAPAFDVSRFRSGTDVSSSGLKGLKGSRLTVALKETGEDADFWSEGGSVFQLVGGRKPEKLHSLGPAGTLSFRMLSERALFAKILADSGAGAAHEVGVRLEVNPSEDSPGL